MCLSLYCSCIKRCICDSFHSMAKWGFLRLSQRAIREYAIIWWPPYSIRSIFQSCFDCIESWITLSQDSTCAECECDQKNQVRMRQNESLHVAIVANANVLSDGKSLQIQGGSRVARTARRKNCPNRIRHLDLSFPFGLRISGTVS